MERIPEHTVVSFDQEEINVGPVFNMDDLELRYSLESSCDWPVISRRFTQRLVFFLFVFLFLHPEFVGRPLGLTLLCKFFSMLWVSLSLFSKLSPFELYSSALFFLCLRRSVVVD